MRRYYFDHAAATPLDPVVEKAMKPYWSAMAGNPGSLHWFGQQASAAVFVARETIAEALGCRYQEIVFTGSATEANNLALRGAVKSVLNDRNVLGVVNDKITDRTIRTTGTNRTMISAKPKIIVSAIEHESILDTCKDLEKEGVEVVYLPVSKKGIVDPAAVAKALDERTILVSIMYANNEIGTIQPIREISKIIADFRDRSHVENVRNGVVDKNKRASANGKTVRTIGTARTSYPLFHTDAVQAFNYLSCNVEELGVDLLTLSAQKIYGPKGVGLLYVRDVQVVVDDKTTGTARTVPLLEPLITGGGQEHGMRSGTENVPGIVGFAAAVKHTEVLREKEARRLRTLQTYFLKELHKFAPAVTLNGDWDKRIPNNLNIDIPPPADGKGSAQELVIALDLAGFAVSPGSACAARTCAPSHVLRAIGRSPVRAMSGIRITFGRQTDKKALDSLLRTLRNLLKN